MDTSKWTDEYYEVFNRELAHLRKCWPSIATERLQLWAERVTDKRLNIPPEPKP